jgi:tRNA-specific adenosine deaminase 3
MVKERWVCLLWGTFSCYTFLRTSQLPIAAYVPYPYDGQDTACFTAHDTRKSTSHPLRHAVMNVIRKVADHQAVKSPFLLSPPDTASSFSNENGDGSRNGSNYLLTSMTLFTTHEPCIMCSMALLHSRVKEIVYLVPMEKTGGCGSLACLSKLNGVNHRFGICRWNGDSIDIAGLQVVQDLDA